MRRATKLLLGCAVIVIASIVGATDKGRNATVVGIWRGEFDNFARCDAKHHG
jgi:hypothetical protein